MEYEEDRIGRIGWGVENSIAYCSLSIYIYMYIYVYTHNSDIQCSRFATAGRGSSCQCHVVSWMLNGQIGDFHG